MEYLLNCYWSKPVSEHVNDCFINIGINLANTIPYIECLSSIWVLNGINIIPWAGHNGTVTVGDIGIMQLMQYK